MGPLESDNMTVAQAREILVKTAAGDSEKSKHVRELFRDAKRRGISEDELLDRIVKKANTKEIVGLEGLDSAPEPVMLTGQRYLNTKQGWRRGRQKMPKGRFIPAAEYKAGKR